MVLELMGNSGHRAREAFRFQRLATFVHQSSSGGGIYKRRNV